MFETFWKQYPRKIAKRMAAKEWAKLTPAEQAKALAVMPLQVRAWKGQDKQFIPHARTWLHQGRFDDEFEVEATATDKWLEALYGHESGRGLAVRPNAIDLDAKTAAEKMAER
jgi:hypothetical protein